jgi:hypothetical protein
MFPKNWDITRVKQEIALVYEQMVKEGVELKFTNNKYKKRCSTGTFEIRIEVDNLGNITNAYPL